MLRPIRTLVALAVICLPGLTAAGNDKTVDIHLKLSPGICSKPLTGRVYVLTCDDVYNRPLDGPQLPESSPFFATNVRDWLPGNEVVITGETAGYPYPVNDMPAATWIVQAVLDTNTVERNFQDSPDRIPGKIFSRIATFNVRDGQRNSLVLELDRKAEGARIEETDYVKDFQVRSNLLSSFYKRPVAIKAAVILPPSYYRDSSRKYAVVFVLPGFETRYTRVFQNDYQIGLYGMNRTGLENIYVFLDLGCPLGFHEFANSENNGPWATAFADEFIPALEKQYRVFSDPGLRFLTGHSSGAWAGLWLQINYPEQFGGVWAVSPDPVDFSSFCGCNLYDSSANFIREKGGEPLKLNSILLDIDSVIGEGWQMGSFESVFSPRGPDGAPLQLWDRISGSIDHKVAETWRKYDIRLMLESSWPTLAPRLKGKIHIYVADDDPFLLDEPIRSLQDAMTALNADLDINILPKGGHNIWDEKMKQIFHRQIDQIILNTHPEAAGGQVEER